MKKFLIILTALFFTGCLDIIQYNEIKDKTLNTTVRFSFSKELTKKQGSESLNFDQFTQNPQLKELNIETAVEQFESNGDTVVLLKISAPEKILKQKRSHKNMFYLPYIDKEDQYLYIFSGDDNPPINQ